MPSSMEKIGRMSRGRFYLALIYLVWSLLPHFHVLVHSHAGDSHFHASYSATEVETANRVLDLLEPDDAMAASPAGFGGSATRYAADPAESSSGNVTRPDAGSELHGHFLEDPNVAGLASQAQSVSSRSFLVSPGTRRYQDPSFRVLRRASARGPPSFLPA